MWLNYFSVLLIPFIVVRKSSGELITDEDQAREFLRCKDETIARRCEARKYFESYYLVDTRANDFAWQNFSDPLLKRAFQITAEDERRRLRMKDPQVKEWSKKLDKLRYNTGSILSNARVCIYHSEEKTQADENCTMLPENKLAENFYKAGNADERKYYWAAWRESVGKIRNAFLEGLRIEIESNKYPNGWLRDFDETSPSILEDVDRAFQDIFPLFKELHAFVRRRLIITYKNEQISSDGPIPSHLFGLNARNWFSVKEVALPYPEANVDVTKIMKERNMKTIDMLKLAEDFFHSTGLPNIDDSVWNNSKTPSGNCTPAVIFDQSMCRRKLRGILACIPAGEYNLHSIIGYMVDIFQFEDGRPDWPRLLRQLPSIAFRPALQQVVELSTWTNKYMASKGFVQAVPTVSEKMSAEEMNDLMMAALRFLPELVYMYKAAKWRLDSYTPIFSDNNYNQKWWEYREFIGTVYSFQFHKAICEEIGHNDSLHRCSLYGEKAFGDKIRNVYYLGNSVPPPEALSMMTNGASDKMDTKPLLEYFQPLYEWLKTKNKN